MEPSFTVSSIVLRLAQVGGNVINPLQANISLVCFKTSVGFSEETFPSSHSLPNVKLQKFQKLQTSNQHVLSLPSLSPKSRCFQVGLPPSKNPKSQRRQYKTTCCSVLHLYTLENVPKGSWSETYDYNNLGAPRCPQLKTVPYVCPPGAEDTSQCLYGSIIISLTLISVKFPSCYHLNDRSVPWDILARQ